MNPAAAHYKRAGLPIPDQRAFLQPIPIPDPAALKRGRDSENIDNLMGQVANIQFGSSPCFDDSPVKKSKDQMSLIGRLHKLIKNEVGNSLTAEEIESIADAVIFAFTPKEVSPSKRKIYLEEKDDIVPFDILYNYEGRNAFVDLECSSTDGRKANVIIKIELSNDEELPSRVQLIDATFEDIIELLSDQN